MSTLTASEIVHLLAEKHASDVFVAECKTGSTWGGCQRLDAWAMKRSWSPWTTIGYEVKVSRSDFERDQKWIDYLEFCHKFSFVCGAGLIKAVDLPKDVGLIWVSKSGRLHTKRKAARREPNADSLLGVLAYVLMSRSVIVRDMHEANRGKVPDREFGEMGRLKAMRERLAVCDKRRELAKFVNAHVRLRYSEMEARAKAAEDAEARVQDVVDHLRKRGVTEFDPRSGWSDWGAKRQIDELLGHVDLADLVGALTRVERAIASTKEEIERVKDV